MPSTVPVRPDIRVKTDGLHVYVEEREPSGNFVKRVPRAPLPVFNWDPSTGEEPVRHPLSQMFHDALRELGDMHDLKQADYGSDDNPFANIVNSAEAIGISAWKGALLRMNDKMTRLNRAARTGKLSNESVEDSLIDLAVYSTIALVLRRQRRHVKRSGLTG